MHSDGLIRRNSMEPGYIVQIGAVLTTVACGNFKFLWLGETHVIEARDIMPQNRLYVRMNEFQCIKIDEDRTIRRVQIAHACDRFQNQEPEERAYLTVRFGRHLPIEPHQQRLIARRTKFSVHPAKYTAGRSRAMPCDRPCGEV